MRRSRLALLLPAVAAVFPSLADPSAILAETISNVQPAALDQPRINALIRRSANGEPISFEDVFNIQAFYDTGASGVLLSPNTADFLGIQKSTVNGEEVKFFDVGVAGTDFFNVSEQVHISIAPFHPDTDTDNPATYNTVYNHSFGPIRMQLTQPGDGSNPLLDDLDVFGVPTMRNKVVVMDPKPVNTFFDTMRTYVYNPGTPYNPAEADSNPGIPTTSRHIKLRFADFTDFTVTTPPGAQGPTLNANPFIGPSPLRQFQTNPPPDDTPGIRVEYNGHASEGSWLFDTGAAASIISTAQAQNLGVSYRPNQPDNSPILDGVPEDQQFTLTIGGIGGTKKIAGFFLDSLLLRTTEGNKANNDDPNHIKFLGAPVLVTDITVDVPNDNKPAFTLDGIFGMNYLVASAYVIEQGEGELPIIGALTFGNFNWAVYDDQNGILGLDPAGSTGSSGQVSWFGNFEDDNGHWDTVSESWIRAGQISAYQDGDDVVFDDGIIPGFIVNTEIRVDEPVAPHSLRFNNSVIDEYIIAGNYPIYGQTGLIKEGTGTVILRNHNTYKGITDIRAGSIFMQASQDIGPVTVRSGAHLVMSASQKFEGLNVDGGEAELSAGRDKVLVVQRLAIGAGGKLDLTDNALVFNVDPLLASQRVELSKVMSLIRQARDTGTSGKWSGPGLTSYNAAVDTTGATTLAAALNRDANGLPVFSTFAGQDVTKDSILVLYTYAGDANMDGVVNGQDYFAIDKAFLTQKTANPLTGWFNGDFNLDGKINIDDYLQIDLGFRNQGLPLNPIQAGPLNAGVPSPVPEPATLGLLTAAATATLRRRRR